MQREPELIERSTEEGTRAVALALLSEADEAARALARRDDDEALHDFRVALRRTRSALRAFRPWLAVSIRRKHEKRLKRLARATNAARDAEVQLGWLDTQRDALGAGSLRPGLEYLVARLRDQRREGDRGHARLLARYRELSGRLRRRLSRYDARLDGGGRVPFSAAMGGLLSEQLARTRSRLAAVRGATDERRVHRARIEAKRLRYLLEALRGSGQVDPRPAVKHLKRLQDLLGELHDAHVLTAEVASALADASAERARRLHRAVVAAPADPARTRRALRDSPRPGLLAVARRLAARRDALHAALVRGWCGDGLAALAADVQALVDALQARAGGALETRRRFRLSALPPALADVPPREVQEGWLPGRLRERVLRERGPSGERCSRALAQGAGRWRLAVEEEVSRETFEVLWLLTDGRRSSRLRWEVVEGGLPWRVEELAGRGVWIAEVRSPPGAAQAPLPDWLAPLVVAEVTDDPSFSDERLAGGSAEASPAATGAPAAPPG